MEQVIEKLGLSQDIMDWDKDTRLKVAIELRKATKPMAIACNKIDVPGAEKNFERLKKEFSDYMIVPCSAESELALKEAAKHELIKYIPGEDNFSITNEEKVNEKQKKALEFIKSNVLEKYSTTGIQNVLDKAVFELLKYIAIFPGGINKLQDQHGNVLPDCFLLPHNSTALDFAFHLHTDIGNNFIKAIDVRSKKPVGKEYILKHRDVMEIATSK
jgi:ribosome-binding ATPase YchF (GTP1/OBG family)